MLRCLKSWVWLSSSHRDPPLRQRRFSAVPARQTQTGEYLAKLVSVQNIRDLSEACSSIAPGKIFRSACPVAASAEDVRLLKQTLNIRCMVDLRSDYERQHDQLPPGGMFSDAVQRLYSRHKAKLKLQESGGKQQRTVLNMCSLLERDRYYRSMITKLPYRKTAQILFWRVWNEHWAKILAIREINRQGLPGLYETILETSGQEIKQALEILTESAEGSGAAIFFCKVGKDRTGLLAAMVLACCGASADEIISDYIRSDGVDQIALGSMEKDKELKELDTALFSRAPAEAMRQTMDYINSRYGSIRGYLDFIGFDASRQQRLAAALASPAPHVSHL